MPLTAINADESARVSVCRFGFVQAVISEGVPISTTDQLGAAAGHFNGYPASVMGYTECDRLLAEYERLKSDYATAVQTLGSRRDTTVAPGYIGLRTAADEARIDCEVARLEFEQHKRIHAKAN